MESKVDEIGVVVDDALGDQPQPSLKAKRCNGKLKIYREFGLATLCSLAKENPQSADGVKSVRACDGISGSGIAGLQWKKHLQHLVHVTLAEQGDLTMLNSNIVANCLQPTEIHLDGKRIPGDPYPDQTPTEIHVSSADAKALLIMESFQFIFLNPPKSCVNFIEPAFQNVANGGIVCLVVPDVSIFTRSTQLVQRCYAADVMKTEYLKELAARTVLASIARAATKCNKGINPLYVVSKEDFLLIAVRVHRGNKASDSSVKEIAKLLHCRFCEERIFMEHQLAPEENPYSKLLCQCKVKHTGKTAVLLGPMWKGPIFNLDFLKQLQFHSKVLPLSACFHNLLSLLITESQCLPLRKIKIPHTNVNSLNNISIADIGKMTHMPNSNPMPPAMERNVCDNKETELVQNVSYNQSSTGKRKDNDDIDDGSQETVKRIKTDSSLKLSIKANEEYNVPFYYNTKKCKSQSLPKLDQYVSLLQKAGYLASRTHFDPSCIRTSATVEQFMAVII